MEKMETASSRAPKLWRSLVALVVALPLAGACKAQSKSPEAYHDVLSCKPGEIAENIGTDIAPGAPVADPGSPSDLALKAKELVDKEEWIDAIPVLQRVARGEGQDDAGNRAIAEYELGVAYYHAHRADLSFDAFKALALNPNHPRHREALVWLGNLSFIDSLSGQPIDYIYLYEDADIAPFDTPEHREIGYLLYYLRGRAAYRRGLFEEAIQKMAIVRRYEPYEKLADGCARLARDGVSSGRGPVE